jgi:cardiolipin synthase
MSRVVAANSNCNWLCAGKDVFPAMLASIDQARRSVLLETYIYSPGELGEKFRAALIRARERGAEVRVLIDALGSMTLSNSFWQPLRMAGGQVKFFNPHVLNRFGIRDHRKMLVCDEETAFVGGFNISSEYEGDGVTCGWCDLGLKVEGPLVRELADSFAEMFETAEVQHTRLLHLRRFNRRSTEKSHEEQVLVSGPGRGRNLIKQSLQADLRNARNVKIMVAYFLPTWRLRRELTDVVSRGGSVQLILAGKSDVALSRLAGQSLYRRFLRSNVNIYEYQPQILHAKLLILDDIVYVGSANLDQRSLRINYELMIRFDRAAMAREANEVFERTLKHCRKITGEDWKNARTLWGRLKQRWAYFCLVRIDPWVARWRWRTTSD